MKIDAKYLEEAFESKVFWWDQVKDLLNNIEIDFSDIANFINDEISWCIEDWENPIKLYKNLKRFEKFLKKKQLEIEENVVDLVEENPWEYPQFSITTRQTFQYKENAEYLEKYDELKEFEKKVKTATEMNKKWDNFIDSDWVIIDPVEIKFKRVLTFRDIKYFINKKLCQKK